MGNKGARKPEKKKPAKTQPKATQGHRHEDFSQAAVRIVREATRDK